MDDVTKISSDIISSAQRLYQRNLLAAADGNISVRVHDDCIVMTPAGKAKAWLQAEEMALIKLNGEVISGQPSSESLMHLAVYRACPQAKAVVHAHPPTAIAWTIAHPAMTQLPASCMSELIIAAGDIPIAPYARPGTAAMGEVLQPLLPKHRLIVLSRHGALAWGESLAEATGGMERLEHCAQILATAYQLGGLHSLPPEEVDAIRAIRHTIGDKLI